MPNAYSLSPKVKKIGSFSSSRPYSTDSVISSNIEKIDNNKPIKFDSLEQACEQIKFDYLGVPGVYKLTNKNEPGQFYIGSSGNLARRMEEYNRLTKGLRSPYTSVELVMSKTPASGWSLEFLYITVPQLSLVYEQYAIILFKPTMNRYLKVTPRVNPQWGNSLDNAISVTEKLLSLFDVGSEGHKRLSVFLKTYKVANNLKYEFEDVDNKYCCFLVFVYDINSPDKDPRVYSSTNRALKGLQISYGTLLDYINNNYLYKSNFILSFEPFVADDIRAILQAKKYQEKSPGDNQMRKHITVYNLDNEVVTEFKSGREMATYFRIDGKVARAAIAQGEYQDFLLIAKEVSHRKAIYVFDSNTHELIEKLSSLTKALKYAKVNFYALKSLIESGNSYKGKIYSYRDKL